MEDKTIILKFLTNEYLNDHPVIYLYVYGDNKREKVAIDNIMNLTKEVFSDSIPKHVLLATIKSFLKTKKKEYLKGEIIIKAIYGYSEKLL